MRLIFYLYPNFDIKSQLRVQVIDVHNKLKKLNTPRW